VTDLLIVNTVIVCQTTNRSNNKYIYHYTEQNIKRSVTIADRVLSLISVSFFIFYKKNEPILEQKEIQLCISIDKVTPKTLI
jgi:hypothetical protein